jgi:hypothetical protein
MADRRRADDTPLAPRRPLSGPTEAEGDDTAGKRPLSERVSAAVSAAGSAVSSAASSSGPSSSRTSNRSDGGATTRTTSVSPSKKAAASKTGASKSRPRGTRRARLRLVHLDPWSVMKTSFLLSIAFGIVLVVAVFVVWSVLGAAGVWDSINKTVADLVGGDQAQNFDVENYVGISRVMGFTMIVGVFDVLLITAISTLSAFLYNLSAALLGGVEVTLAEDDR